MKKVTYQALGQAGLFKAIYTKVLAIFLDEGRQRCFALLANKALNMPTISFC